MLNNRNGLIRKLHFLAIILTTSFITIYSLIPLKELPSVESWDKVQHGVAYGFLAFLIGSAYPYNKGFKITLLFCVFLGAFLEFAQTFVPGREGSFGDGFANAIGAGLGLIYVPIVILYFFPINLTNKKSLCKNYK